MTINFKRFIFLFGLLMLVTFPLLGLVDLRAGEALLAGAIVVLASIDRA